MAEALVSDVEKYAKQARNAMVLTVLAALVAVAVLLIDNSIKKAILAETGKAGAMLAEVRKLAGEVQGERATSAGGAGDTPGAGVHGSDGVDGHSAAGAAVDQAVGAAKAASNSRTRSVQSRAQGHG